MYTFVFLWTPALNPHTFVPAPAGGALPGPSAAGALDAAADGGGGGGPARLPLSAGALDGGGATLPHGFVFAIFMTASMVGTALAGRLMAAWRLEAVLQGVFWAGAALLAVPALYHTRRADHALPADVFEADGPHSAAAAAAAAAGPPSASPGLGLAAGGGGGGAPAAAAQLDFGGQVQLLAFCGFEVLIGLFWPSMMALRARYVPEDQRSTIINIFRIPLNTFVCLILWKARARRALRARRARLARSQCLRGRGPPPPRPPDAHTHAPPPPARSTRAGQRLPPGRHLPAVHALPLRGGARAGAPRAHHARPARRAPRRRAAATARGRRPRGWRRRRRRRRRRPRRPRRPSRRRRRRGRGWGGWRRRRWRARAALVARPAGRRRRRRRRQERRQLVALAAAGSSPLIKHSRSRRTGAAPPIPASL